MMLATNKQLITLWDFSFSSSSSRFCSLFCSLMIYFSVNTTIAFLPPCALKKNTFDLTKESSEVEGKKVRFLSSFALVSRWWTEKRQKPFSGKILKKTKGKRDWEEVWRSEFVKRIFLWLFCWGGLRKWKFYSIQNHSLRLSCHCRCPPTHPLYIKQMKNFSPFISWNNKFSARISTWFFAALLPSPPPLPPLKPHSHSLVNIMKRKGKPWQLDLNGWEKGLEMILNGPKQHCLMCEWQHKKWIKALQTSRGEVSASLTFNLL